MPVTRLTRMTRPRCAGPLLVALLGLLSGCGAVNVITPTPAATPTPIVIVEVVTATPQPPTVTPVPSGTAEATAAASAQQATAAATPQTTFHVCPNATTQTAQAIAQLIAGRSFSSRLVGSADGCADLTITIAPGAGVSSGRQSSDVSVGNVSVQIVSQNGTTQVHIGPRGS
jgi:hypothetical protein